jgi:hypothetical protein
MAFAIKKCAYAADPEVKERQKILKADKYDQMVKVKGHEIERRRGAHILYTIVSQMAVMLSALYTGRALTTNEDSYYSFQLGSTP